MAKQNTGAKKPNFKHNKAVKAGKKQGGPQKQNKYEQHSKKPRGPVNMAGHDVKSGPCVRYCGTCISCKIAAADQQNASRIARGQSSFRSHGRSSASW